MKRVYFIKPIDLAGPIKIGCSKSPNNRLKTLSTWSPFALEIIAQVDGAERLEMQFHALLKASHERREWFKATPEVLSVVESVKNGTFDLASLPEPQRLTGIGGGKRSGTKWSPEQRYRSSVFARLRASGTPWGVAYPALRKITSLDDMLTHVEAIEQLVEEHGGKPAKNKWSEFA